MKSTTDKTATLALDAYDAMIASRDQWSAKAERLEYLLAQAIDLMPSAIKDMPKDLLLRAFLDMDADQSVRDIAQLILVSRRELGIEHPIVE